jgi:uncharacterized delta-60 repeat protein
MRVLNHPVQPILGSAGGCDWVKRLEARRLLSDVGQPDPAFADDGVAFTGFAGGNPYGTAVAVTSDGKPVFASAQEVSGSEFATGLNLARFNTDGSLDTSFGTGGKTSVSIARFLIGAATMQSDGRLLVAGTVADANYPTSSNAVLRFIVLRFNTDGSLDTSFGTNGSVRTAFTSIDPTFSAEAKQIAVSSRGEIAVGGSTMRYVEDGDQIGSALAVYNSSGQLLTSFSNDGLLANIVTAPDSDELYGLAFQPDGKLLASYETMQSGSSSDTIALMRYNVDGTPDGSFGTNGEIQSTGSQAKLLLASQIIVAPDKKIILGASNTLDVERLNADGSLDTTFGGGDGIAEPADGVKGLSWGALLLADGKIRVAGPTWVQYNADGTPDPVGTKTTQFPAAVTVDPEAAFDPNGKVIISGRTVNGYSIVRFGRDDVALGNDGTLWVDGTVGDDTISISPLNASARLVRNGVTTDFTKTVKSVQLDLQSGNDVGTISLDVAAVVFGGAGNDSITTAGGNDTISDSSGNDTIITGDGNDSVTDTNGRDSIVTGAGDDHVILGVVTKDLDPEIPPVIASVTAATVNTGAGDDTVVGGGRIQVSLGDGDDTLAPPAGVGTRALDQFNVDGGDGNDQITGSPNADSILGGAGNDVIYGQAGNDTIYGNDGKDWVDGGDGNDSLYGNANPDTIYGGYGDDRVAGNGGNDHLTGGALGGDDGPDGNDRLYGGNGSDALSGDYYHKVRPWELSRWGGLTIRSSSQPGNDWLDGGAGNDTIMAIGGNDTLICGGGKDYLDGGSGNDIFYARDGAADTLVGGAGTNRGTFDDLLDSVTEISPI